MFLEKGFPDYMFGVAYAAMSLAQFACSALWGRLGAKYGYSRIFAIGMPGYGLAQVVFTWAPTPFWAVVGRLLGGSFGSASLVCSMAYVVSVAQPRERANCMAIHAALSGIFIAVGYMMGGVWGGRDLHGMVMFQLGMLFLLGILTLLLVDDPPRQPHPAPFANTKPAQGTGIRSYLTPLMIYFLWGVFFASLATTVYDNSFNYFISAELHFPAAYNGAVRAVIGIIGLVANFTINQAIARRSDGRRPIIYVLAACGILPFLFFWSDSIPYFLLGNLVFFVFKAVYLPIQQYLMTANCSAEESGILSGIFNMVVNMGRILGGLFAGFMYMLGARIPFVIAAVGYLLAAGAGMVYHRQFCQRAEPKSPTVEIQEV